MYNIIILSLFILFLLITIVLGIRLISKGINYSGKIPINKSLYYIGKISMGISWGFCIIQALNININFFNIPLYLSWIGTIIFVIGMIITLISFYNIGISNRFGIPEEDTHLITKGIYRISRNPMYLGFYLTSIASCFYCPNPINIIFALIGILIHHKIVLAEENFLRQRFKDEWLRYIKNVRRYL